MQHSAAAAAAVFQIPHQRVLDSSERYVASETPGPCDVHTCEAPKHSIGQPLTILLYVIWIRLLPGPAGVPGRWRAAECDGGRAEGRHHQARSALVFSGAPAREKARSQTPATTRRPPWSQCQSILRVAASSAQGGLSGINSWYQLQQARSKSREHRVLPTHELLLCLRCSHCGRRGATLGCRVERCKLSFHLACAKTAGATFYPSKFLLACPAHRAAFRREEDAERWARRSGPLWTAPPTVGSCAPSRTPEP